MLKSIKNNNDTNVKLLPDNFNFKLNGIQTVKPNLKMQDIELLKSILGVIFANKIVSKMEKYNIDPRELEQLLNEDVITRFMLSENEEEYSKIFEFDILSKFLHKFYANDQKEIIDGMKNAMHEYEDESIFEIYLDKFKDFLKKKFKGF